MRAGKVYINGVFAGILKETDNPKEYVFKYEESYLISNKEGICLAMPVRKEEYKSDHLFPYFSNLLSEGDNRALQSSYLHLDSEDDFGFLLETARYDTVGAVTVEPIGDERNR